MAPSGISTAGTMMAVSTAGGMNFMAVTIQAGNSKRPASASTG